MEQAGVKYSVTADLKIAHLLALDLKMRLTPKYIKYNMYSCHLSYSHSRSPFHSQAKPVEGEGSWDGEDKFHLCY